jgi:hypothetical protein
MAIVQIADGAFFVPAYSTQTITPAYDTTSTIQALTPGEPEPEPEVDVLKEDARQPIHEPQPGVLK